MRTYHSFMPRTVKGRDLLVYLKDGMAVHTPIEAKMQVEDVRNGQFLSKFHFIVNRNLHSMPPQLRGALCYVRNRIWVVVKAVGRKAILLLLLPSQGGQTRGSQPHFLLVDLLEEMGFYLQQINGERPLPLNPTFNKSPNAPMPLTDSTGCIKMSI